MSACKYCNFRNTSKCVEEQIWEKVDNGELTEEQANIELQYAYGQCEDSYYDYQLAQGERDSGK